MALLPRLTAKQNQTLIPNAKTNSQYQLMILFLIGYRATGKTTIGRRLAEQLNCHWIDTDAEIEKFSQRTIPEIFTEDGEAGFREIERNVIKLIVDRVLRSETVVVSLGGGAVLSQSTQKLIGKRGRVVWLTAPAEELCRRIESSQQSTPRPALTDQSLDQEVSQLLAERQPVYSDCADYTIDTCQLNVDQTVEQIAQWWSEVDK